jgi:hypothetical protein
MSASNRRRARHWKDVDPARRGLVSAWFSFTAMFGFLRVLTWLIHIHVGGLGNVSAGSVHLHHYVWGILLLVGVAIFGLVDRSAGARVWMGVALGVGVALIVDEAALLIELRDVYWSGFGAVSVALAVIIIGLSGGVLAMTRAPEDSKTAS